jgi:ATP synthase protein I
VTAALPGRGERSSWAQYLSYSAIGIEMGAALVVGMAIGWFLDRTFHTPPWCLVIFTAFGIAAGFRNVIAAARKATADEDKL